jgi:hypothetical protein
LQKKPVITPYWWGGVSNILRLIFNHNSFQITFLMSLLLKLRFSSLGFLPFVFLVPQDFKVIWLSVYLTWWRLFGFQYTWPDDGYLAFSIPDLMMVTWLSVYLTWRQLFGFQYTWPDDGYLAFSIPDLMTVISETCCTLNMISMFFISTYYLHIYMYIYYSQWLLFNAKWTIFQL